MKRSRRFLLGALASCVLLHSLLGLIATTSAAPIDSITLGSAGVYSLLAGTALTKGDVSSISGNLNSSAGIFPGTVAPEVAALFISTGATSFENGTAPAGLAQVDLASALSSIATLTPTRVTPLLSNEVLTPGIYAAASGEALAVTVGLTLDGGGDPNSRFIFRTDTALNIDATVRVVLTNGAQERNVFWEVGTAVTIGANAQLVGNFLVTSAATIGADSVIRGSMLCQGAVTVGANSSIIFDALLAPVPPASPSPSPSASPLASAIPSPTPSETPRETPSPTPIPQLPPAPQPVPQPLPVLAPLPSPVASPILEPTPTPSPVESVIPLPMPILVPSPEPSPPPELLPLPIPTPISVVTPLPSPSPKKSSAPEVVSHYFPKAPTSGNSSGPKSVITPNTYFDITPETSTGGASGDGLHIDLHNIEIGSDILITVQRLNNG